MQSKVVSGIEATVNVMSGYCVSVVLYVSVAPLFGWDATWGQSAGLAVLFTISSLLRVYLWRRFFTNGLHRRTVELVQRFTQ